MPVADAPHGILNPFIFATLGYYHGEPFESPPGRTVEIHLKNKPVSSQFHAGLLSTFDDFSNLSSGATFVSANNLPSAIEIPAMWSHPVERIDLIKAYPGKIGAGLT